MQPPAPFKARYPDGSVREVDTFVVTRSRSEAWRKGKIAHASADKVEIDYAGSFPGYLIFVDEEPDAEGVRVSLHASPLSEGEGPVAGEGVDGEAAG